MHWQQWILALSLVGGMVFAIRAIYSRHKRVWLAIPAGILLFLAGYEYVLDQWEKTVTAPIRLDMLVEIPLMIACLAWGTVSIVLAMKTAKKADQRRTL
jgi:exosortase/archaeosortase